MRASRLTRWQLLALTALLMLMSVPVWSQAKEPPKELTLNAVTIKSTFLEVMAHRGAPHYVGPALQSADTVQARLDPKVAPTGQMGMPGAPMAPGIGMPGMPPMMPGAPSMMGGPGMAGAGLPIKPREEYIIWMYEGNGQVPNADAGFTTFVFFNKRGVVEGVVVNAKSPNINPGCSTSSGITIGNKQLDVVRKYDWPDPFIVVGPYYYFSYPGSNVTFGIDQATRKVTSMAIGLPFVATLAQVGGGTTNGNMTPPSPMGGPYPGMAPYPGVMRY